MRHEICQKFYMTGLLGQKFCTLNCGITNQRQFANFRPMVMKRIQHGLQYVESMLYSFQSDQTKIGGVSLIHNTSYFLYYD